MKLSLLFAWALLVLGYFSLHYILKGATHLVPIALISFGLAILIALDYQVKKNKLKSKKP